MRTRCAILAAANPVDGKFIPPELDKKMRPYTQQITLAKPLLTRFDCIWTMLDRPEKEGDRRIGSHIASYRQAGTPEWLIDEGIESMPSSSDAARGTVDGSEIIEPEIFQKYVAYAKKNCHPKVTDTAREKIVEYYVQARLQGGGINESGSTYTDGEKVGMEAKEDSLSSVPISARSIESLIRLAEARARTRLSNEATIEDAQMAIATFDTWRYELMGDNYDETSMVSGKTTTKRNIEHNVLSFIVQRYNQTDSAVELHEILTAMEKFRISQEQVEDILDVLCNNGTLFRPASNRNEYQPV
jgi:replicative DNA helicase Mcm